MSYGDVIPILQEAANRPGGLRYRLPSYAKAINFRQRCYRYRQQLRRANTILEGLAPSTPYDDLLITLETPSGKQIIKKDDADLGPVDVVISHMQIVGEILDADGNPTTLGREPSSGLDLE